MPGRSTWPDENEQELLAKVARDHGPAIARIAATAIHTPRPRAAGRKRRAKLPPPIPNRGAQVAAAGSDRPGPSPLAKVCPGCAATYTTYVCLACKNVKGSNKAGATRDGHDLDQAERDEIVRKIRGFVSPLQVAKEHGVTTNTVRYIVKVHHRHP